MCSPRSLRLTFPLRRSPCTCSVSCAFSKAASHAPVNNYPNLRFGSVLLTWPRRGSMAAIGRAMGMMPNGRARALKRTTRLRQRKHTLRNKHSACAIIHAHAHARSGMENWEQWQGTLLGAASAILLLLVPADSADAARTGGRAGGRAPAAPRTAPRTRSTPTPRAGTSPRAGAGTTVPRTQKVRVAMHCVTPTHTHVVSPRLYVCYSALCRLGQILLSCVRSNIYCTSTLSQYSVMDGSQNFNFFAPPVPTPAPPVYGGPSVFVAPPPAPFVGGGVVRSPGVPPQFALMLALMVGVLAYTAGQRDKEKDDDDDGFM